MECLLALGDQALWLRGNGDRWLVEAREGRLQHNDPTTRQLVEWASARMTPQHLNLLAALPLTRSVDLSCLGRVGFCHATARSDNEMLLVDSSIEHYASAFSSLDAQTIFVGHSHMPFDRLFDRRRIVNTGAVGMPYGHTGASWALIGEDVTLRRTQYDIDDASRRIARTAMPDVDEFIRAYVRSTPSDREALAAFHGIALKDADAGMLPN